MKYLVWFFVLLWLSLLIYGVFSLIGFVEIRNEIGFWTITAIMAVFAIPISGVLVDL